MEYEKVFELNVSPDDTGWPPTGLCIHSTAIPLFDGKVVHFGISRGVKPPPIAVLQQAAIILGLSPTVKESVRGSVYLITCSHDGQIRAWNMQLVRRSPQVLPTAIVDKEVPGSNIKFLDLGDY